MASRRRATLRRGGQSTKHPGGGGPITSGHIWAFLIVGFLLGSMILSLATEGRAGTDPGNQWRIESVYRGKVQVISVRTGDSYQIDDAELVRKCLAGQLKRGDVINW